MKWARRLACVARQGRGRVSTDWARARNRRGPWASHNTTPCVLLLLLLQSGHLAYAAVLVDVRLRVEEGEEGPAGMDMGGWGKRQRIGQTQRHAS